MSHAPPPIRLGDWFFEPPRRGYPARQFHAQRFFRRGGKIKVILWHFKSIRGAGRLISRTIPLDILVRDWTRGEPNPTGQIVGAA